MLLSAGIDVFKAPGKIEIIHSSACGEEDKRKVYRSVVPVIQQPTRHVVTIEKEWPCPIHLITYIRAVIDEVMLASMTCTA